MTPKILLITTSRWFATTRLAMAFAQLGCDVEAMCPSGHLLTKTRVVRRLHSYSGLLPMKSIRDATDAAQPDLVVPCDDLATKHLHHWHAIEKQSGGDASRILVLLERSLGIRNISAPSIPEMTSCPWLFRRGFA